MEFGAKQVAPNPSIAMKTSPDLPGFSLITSYVTQNVHTRVKRNYSRNRLSSIRLSQRKSTLYADLLNNRPKVTLKGHIGALIYLLYK